MNFIAKIQVFNNPQPIQEIDGMKYQASQYHHIAITAKDFETARKVAEKYAQGKPIIFVGKKIGKNEAHKKYGVCVSGVNSLYTYYLTDDGKVIDDDGDIRYAPYPLELSAEI